MNNLPLLVLLFIIQADQNVQHLGHNRDGWFVAETVNFRIFHKQTDDYAEKIIKAAERVRTETQYKWFGCITIWSPRCEIVLYSTKQEYVNATGIVSSGHASIWTDKSGVMLRRVSLRGDVDVIDTILPHETTHAVLAGCFGSSRVPRWVDEGIAVLSESVDKVEQHRHNFLNAQKFGVKELMNLQDYPERLVDFYAHSVVLVEFLTKRKGPITFTRFVRDGLSDGYDLALRRHYNLTYDQLQKQLDEQ